MDPAFDKLSQEIEKFYQNIREYSLFPNVTAAEIREHLNNHFNFTTPRPLDSLTTQVSAILRDWTLHSNHPHYFGLFVPGTMPASTVADALVALYNPQLGVWAHAPAACEIERFTLQFLMRKFGIDVENGCGNFTTGGTEANLSAVLTALIKHFPEYGDSGLRSLKKQPVFYVSEEAHHSFMKIGQVTGLGYDAVRNVPTDDKYKLDLDKLQKMYDDDIDKGFHPFMAAATAGTTSSGTIDPLREMAGFCEKNKLWFHVDAAYGGAAIMSDKLKSALDGIERADSITCDAHKWFSVSMGAGMFFCRHKKHVAEAFHAGAAYLPESIKDTIDAYNTTLQCSRRFIGLKLFMSLAELGEKGYSDLVETQARLGNLIKTRLSRAGFEIVNDTPLPVVCFSHKLITSGKMSVQSILDKLYANGNFWISGTRLKKKLPVLRACVTSYRTTDDDVEQLAASLTSILSGSPKTHAVTE